MEWLKFKHPAVRDLAWSLLSPSLLGSLPQNHSRTRQYSLNQEALTPELGRWLQQVDNNPENLQRKLDSLHSTRLGIYFESLWQFYLEHQHQLITHNLQINEVGRTLGEIDFLYRRSITLNKTLSSPPNKESLIHAEAAVKFYLGCPDTQTSLSSNELNWHAWIGPNAKDRLSIKMRHMLEHQLALSEQDAARAPINNALLDGETANDLQPEAILRGRFFYPFDRHMPAPSLANTNHLRGYWCYQHQLSGFIHSQTNAIQTQTQWLVLERHQWFTDVETDKSAQLLNDDELVRFFQQENNAFPRIIALMKYHSSNPHWKEVLRCFVMPNHWPDRERPSTRT